MYEFVKNNSFKTALYTDFTCQITPCQCPTHPTKHVKKPLRKSLIIIGILPILLRCEPPLREAFARRREVCGATDSVPEGQRVSYGPLKKRRFLTSEGRKAAREFSSAAFFRSASVPARNTLPFGDASGSPHTPRRLLTFRKENQWTGPGKIGIIVNRYFGKTALFLKKQRRKKRSEWQNSLTTELYSRASP